MTAQEVEQQLRAAFPAKQFSGVVTHGCTCEECTDLEASFRDQSWNTVSEETMRAHYDGLPLLSDEALVAFLPAWLSRALSDLDDGHQPCREFALYFLALYLKSSPSRAFVQSTETKRLRRLYGILSVEQVLAVEQWLKFIQEYATMTDWDLESIDGALGILDQVLGRT